MGNNVAETLKKVADAQSARRSVYRPQAEPMPRVMCSVRSAGHYRVAPPWTDMPRVKDFWEIFWSIQGRGQFRLPDGNTQLLGENEFFWYYPGEEHQVEPAEDGEWVYCWMTLDNAGTAAVLEEMDLPRHGHGRPCPESLFRQVMHQLQDTTPDGRRACSMTAYRILLEAAAAVAGEEAAGIAEPLAEKVREKIENEFTDAMFSIESLARELDVHRSTLYRVFRRAYGVSPSQYLQDRRIQRGLSLLRESALPIGLVAYAGGFTDSNYFSKLIRKVTGQSPADFRKG